MLGRKSSELATQKLDARPFLIFLCEDLREGKKGWDRLTTASALGIYGLPKVSQLSNHTWNSD